MKWEQVIYHVNKINNTTWFEKNNRIFNKNCKLIKKLDDIAYFEAVKSDGRISLIVAVLYDKHNKDWFILNLSDPQIVSLTEDLKEFYNSVEYRNDNNG